MEKLPKSDVGFLPTFLAGRWPVVALLACHFALGLSAASRKSVTFDEITHLSSGYTYWATNDYRMDPESGNWPQRWAALPVWLEGYRLPALDDVTWQTGNQWDFADKLFHGSGNDADAMLLHGRAMIGLLSVTLGLLVYLCSRQLFGPIAGLISLALYAFSPTMLSHGFLVTADLAIALFFTLAVRLLWELLHRINWSTFAASCFALAGLFLSKYSGVLIIPMATLLVAIRLFNPTPLIWALGRRREIKARFQQLATFFGVALIQVLVVAALIWISYGLRYSKSQPSPVPQPALVSLDMLLQNTGNFGFTRSFIELAKEHHLLPESYLYGFAFTMLTAQQRQAFLNGAFSIHGWTSYFPYVLLVKTPPEVFVILFLALTSPWFWRRSANAKNKTSRAPSDRLLRLYSIAPVLVLLGVYWIFSLTSHLNIGHRHLLPTYPAMFILAGAAAAWFQSPQAEQPKESAARKNKVRALEPPKATSKLMLAARWLVALSLLLIVVEAFAAWPNYLAYFNLLAGGSQNGYKHLVDSSLDWGQDLKGLKQWLDSHPDDARHVYLCYFGTASPEYYGIDATLLPGFFNRYQPHVPEPLTAGTYCISATLLEGVYLKFPSKWNALFENYYQQCREQVAAYQRAASDPEARKALATGASQAEVDRLFTLYENLRLARLCSFLRAKARLQRRPHDDDLPTKSGRCRSGDAGAARRAAARMRARCESMRGNSLNGTSRARLAVGTTLAALSAWAALSTLAATLTTATAKHLTGVDIDLLALHLLELCALLRREDRHRFGVRFLAHGAHVASLSAARRAAGPAGIATARRGARCAISTRRRIQVVQFISLIFA